MRVFLGRVCHLTDDPWQAGETALQCIDDGALLIQGGLVKAVTTRAQVCEQLAGQQFDLIDHRNKLIMPGFIDAHLHFPQTEMIASYGEQLLQWLEKYTFPAEQKFFDRSYAASAAEYFLDTLLRHGTTTAMVYATVHEASADALFAAAKGRNLRLLTGKIMMDRNCPENLRDTPESGYQQSRSLIERWHAVGRLSYVVTPRFAPTSSDRQLAYAGQLLEEYDGLYLQSHVAENQAEVAWVRELFPWARSYLDVYDQFGLLGRRSVYGHCIHLDDTDRARMSETGTVAAFCPTSNLFLGSGLFDLFQARQQGVRTALATDVGGGTSFSMLRTADEAYKVTQLCGCGATPLALFYEMTLGAAKALSLDKYLGNFEVGKEADLVVLDCGGNSLLERRLETVSGVSEELFALFMLGDDRNTVATYIQGALGYSRDTRL